MVAARQGQPRTIEISVRAERLEDGLASVLEAIVAAAQGEGLIIERGSLSLPFKAEGQDLPMLVSAMIDSLLDAIEGQGEAISAVAVAGILTTDRGYTGWGFATIARGTPVALRRVDLSAPIRIGRHGPAVEITTTANVG